MLQRQPGGTSSACLRQGAANFVQGIELFSLMAWGVQNVVVLDRTFRALQSPALALVHEPRIPLQLKSEITE